MMKELENDEIAELAKKLSNDVFFRNDLLDTLSSGIGKVFQYRGIYIIKYPAILVISSENNYETSIEDAAVIRSFNSMTIFAKASLLTPILSSFTDYKAEYRKMMTIRMENFHKQERDDRIRVLRTRNDFLSLFKLYREVPGFGDRFSKVEDEANLEDFLSREYPFTAVALFENGKALSGAYISNHKRQNAMVSGVVTHPNYRHKGFATAVLSELVDIAFTENMMKMLSLWYNNEEAGKIYRKTGFKDEGSWLYLKKEQS